MIKRIYKQDLHWLDVDNRIVNENTTIAWKLFGIFTIRRRTITVNNTFEVTKTKNTPGFRS